MLRDLDYQARVLKTFDEYLAFLSTHKQNADRIAALSLQQPELGIEIPDFPAKAWDAMRAAGKLPPSRKEIPPSPRHDGIGRPVPNVVLKVPTGGGKTYLAASALSRIFGRHLGLNTGFVLWIVPNEAIYTQTKKQLTDRQHPYRQLLDRAAAGRVRILEKDDRLDARDIESNLCVMLLMLQSANRQTRESLKMFQDRGDVHGFFPDEGDQEAHRKALEATPNLDAYGKAGEADAFWPMVKDSLGNALRLIRPVVVMDEGHRAISELAFATLYGFNPCFVLELTATPKDVAATGGMNARAARPANVLVEVLGTELDREGMIKMPLNLDPRQGADWRATLAAALDRLNVLDREAQRLHAERGRYIRPILLIQVERTGEEQRDGKRVHALDAKEWLKTAGLDEAEIAVKTANTNDLNNPENLDLLAPTNRVRAIITKQALQEGWDCPFAYVLCALAASSNLTGMTQLIGRILRQPQAEKIGIPALDECYVITHHADTASVVQAIKQGLEEDGLGDLVKEIRASDASAGARGPRTVPRREKFRKTEIYLPLVLRVENGIARPLDYDADILYGIEWRGLDPAPLVARIPENAQAADGQMRRIRLADTGSERIVSEETGINAETLRLDPAYAVRMVSDIVPNPWVAREIVGAFVKGLTARGFTETWLGAHAGLIVEELRKWLEEQRSAKGEALFRVEVVAGRIQFRLRVDGNNWRMPFEAETYEPESGRQLLGRNGGPLERSLFAPLYEGDFSSQDERDIAVYLDGDQALRWWHRNVARTQYALQGWRRDKVYPDFIFAVQREDSSARIAVLEMKGQHLAGNEDTEYKKAVLQLMSKSFAWDTTVPIGAMELVRSGGETVECDLVLMNEWQRKLPGFLAQVQGPCQDELEEVTDEPDRSQNHASPPEPVAGQPRRRGKPARGVPAPAAEPDAALHGLRARAGEPGTLATGARTASTTPLDATRHLDTAAGTLPYGEVAERLAVRIVECLEEILVSSPEAIRISPDWIANIHRCIAGELFPDWAGKFRTMDVQVGTHLPPPGHEVPVLVRNFSLDLEERLRHLAGIESLAELLAWVDWRFQWIHPFKDFNGRVGRILLTALLYKLKLPPVDPAPVDETQRAAYLAALRAADRGDIQPLTRLWVERLSQL